MTPQPLYTIERWPHGWTLSGERHAIPITDLNEALPLFPKGAVMDGGIAHHLRLCGHPKVCQAIATPKDADKWRKEIHDRLLLFLPEERWWYGTDTGTSSAAIFSVFCKPQMSREARDYSRSNTPQDAADLGRCTKMLALFPQWEEHLHKVAETFPNTAWPEIIRQWEKLTKASPEAQTKLLREIHAK